MKRLIAVLLLLAVSPLLARTVEAQTPTGFARSPVYSRDGQAGVVFLGSTVAQLEAAASGAGATGIWAQDASGEYALLVIGGPSFINDPFRARFATGFTPPVAITLTRPPGQAGPPAPVATSVASPAAPVATSVPSPAGPPAPGQWVRTQPPKGASPATGEWIAVGAPGGKTILARVLRPEGAGPFPAVVLLHSQTGFSNAYVTLGEEIARAGYVTVVGCWFAGNYDGTTTADPPPPLPLADGIECPDGPPIKTIASPAAVEDITALITATKTLSGVRSDRVGLVGNSRGSIVAVLTAAAKGNALQAVVAIGGAPPGGPLIAQGITAPLLLIQGSNDSVVPVINAQMLEQALTAMGRKVQSRYYEGHGHGILFDTPQHADAMQRTIDFLRTHLAR